MLDTVLNNEATEPEEFTLTVSDAYRLMGACIELVNLCSKVTGKIDPALGSMVDYARQEALGGLCFREGSCS